MRNDDRERVLSAPDPTALGLFVSRIDSEISMREKLSVVEHRVGELEKGVNNLFDMKDRLLKGTLLGAATLIILLVYFNWPALKLLFDP